MTRRTAAVTIFAVAALGMAGCSSDSASNANEDGGNETWRFGVLPCAADCGFLRMAQEKDLYEKYGVDVEFVELQSAAQIYPALAAGEVDAIEQSPGGLLIGAEQANMEATIIGSSMEGLPYAIYASSDITDLSDLEGRSMAISSPTGMPALVAELMVESAGVDWTSLQQVNAGGNADRYRAVVAGTADAASSPADYVPMAEDDGINVVALASEVIPEFPRYMIIASNESLEKKPDAATAFLAGHIEGLRYALENPEETKQLGADALETTPDDPNVTWLHDLVVDQELVDPDGGIDMDKIEYQLEVLVDTGQMEGNLDLSTVVDDSFQQRALEMIDAS